jgi:hypothetical protein
MKASTSAVFDPNRLEASSFALWIRPRRPFDVAIGFNSRPASVGFSPGRCGTGSACSGE